MYIDWISIFDNNAKSKDILRFISSFITIATIWRWRLSLEVRWPNFNANNTHTTTTTTTKQSDFDYVILKACYENKFDCIFWVTKNSTW